MDMETLLTPEPPPHHQLLYRNATSAYKNGCLCSEGQCSHCPRFGSDEGCQNIFLLQLSTGLNEVDERQFQDNVIATEFKCGADKCGYLIIFGLASFYKEKLEAKACGSDISFVVFFDNSLNNVLHKS
ncbi:unnamed protein product [Owenia fusiformis]|uniref:Uncharacterized protein n=1 Tax=Owenia fusiformis TaxID=6347 RepID=A0A8S4NWL6_OWEFU|nr:unnamed protein product [Owenia fusiformis]